MHTTPYFRIFWPYGLLWLAVAGLYGQSLGFGYVWDDNALFLDNTLLRQGDWSWAAMARPILPGTSYFRPLVLASWMAEMQLFRLTPAYSHAINVALHGINTCLLYFIACQIFERYRHARAAALWAALLYTVHPCHAEAVAWISGRFDLLATALLMASCAVAMARATPARCALLALLALGSLLSKETGVLLAPLLVLLALARFPGNSLRQILSELSAYLLACMVAASAYFWLRREALGFASYSEFGLPQLLDAVANYQDWGRKLSFYTFMAFAPFSAITPRHDWLIELASPRQHVLALVAALLIATVVLACALRRCTWALLWLGFYMGIFPVLGIVAVAVGETVGAERFLYLPLAMLALAVVALVLAAQERFSAQRIIPKAAIVLGGGWLLLSLLVTHTVASMWESGLRLWSWQYHVNPQNIVVRSWYLMELTLARTPEGNKEFEEEIRRIQDAHNGRLPAEVQVVYAGYLLERNDPESLNYLRGLVDHLPRAPDWVPNQLQKKAREEAFHSAIYLNYVQAVVLYEGDLNEAEKFIDKAQAFDNSGTEYRVSHQRIVVEYLKGHTATARDIYRKNEQLFKSFNLPKIQASMRALVYGYCAREHSADYCRTYSGNFISYLSEAP